jgi:hypothetical protein
MVQPAFGVELSSGEGVSVAEGGGAGGGSGVALVEVDPAVAVAVGEEDVFPVGVVFVRLEDADARAGLAVVREGIHGKQRVLEVVAPGLDGALGGALAVGVTGQFEVFVDVVGRVHVLPQDGAVRRAPLLQDLPPAVIIIHVRPRGKVFPHAAVARVVEVGGEERVVRGAADLPQPFIG